MQAHGILFLLLLAGLAPGTMAQDDSGVPQVTLLIAGPNPDDTDYLFGHTALLVQWPGEEEQAYSYEVYPRGISWEVLPSASIGQAVMDLEAVNASKLFRYYVDHGQEIRRTPVLLTDDEAVRLAQRLETVARDEGELPYDMTRDNCSTRLRDIVDDVLGGGLHAELDRPIHGSVRSLATPYMDHRTIESSMWMFMGGSPVDEPLTWWEATFMPQIFEEALAQPFQSDSGSRVLLGSTQIVDPGTHPHHDDMGYPVWVESLVVGIIFLLGTIAFAMGLRVAEHRTRKVLAVILVVIGVVAGSLFLFMAIAWNGALGSQAAANQNLLVASPLAWGLVVAGVRVRTNGITGLRLLGRLSIASLVLLLVAVVIRWVPGVPAQENGWFIAVAAVGWLGALTVSWTALGRRILFGWRPRPVRLP